MLATQISECDPIFFRRGCLFYPSENLSWLLGITHDTLNYIQIWMSWVDNPKASLTQPLNFGKLK